MRTGGHILLQLLACAVLGGWLMAASGGPAAAQGIETSAPHALLIDAHTNTVLMEKNADEQFEPASLSKLMTVEVVFHAIKEGRLKLTDTFHVSENAWRRGGAASGGSTMFAALNSDIALEDLLRGIIIQSGNDACIVVAEGMAGSEEAFASMLNARAREIGLTASNFTNSTGLPDPNHVVTARDLAKLARHIVNEYPDLYQIYSESEFTWNDIRQHNRNPLLRESPGADGMKTGHTTAAGYGLVGSVVRDGQRVIMVIAGLKSARERAAEARKLIDWSFRAFEQVELFDAGEVVGTARLFGGEKRQLELTGDGAIRILLPRAVRRKLDARIVYRGPIRAPVEQGDRVAELRVSTDDGVSLSVPLYAAEDVARGALHQRALDSVLDLATRWW